MSPTPKRIRASKWQTDLLNTLYTKSPQPSRAQIDQISDETGLYVTYSQQFHPNPLFNFMRMAAAVEKRGSSIGFRNELPQAKNLFKFPPYRAYHPSLSKKKTSQGPPQCRFLHPCLAPRFNPETFMHTIRSFIGRFHIPMIMLIFLIPITIHKTVDKSRGLFSFIRLPFSLPNLTIKIKPLPNPT